MIDVVKTGDVATVDLIAGISYNIGVAAVDVIGNAGLMSEVACATPQSVDDAVKAGCGHCSIGVVGPSSTMFGALAIGTALGLTLRRRMLRPAKRVRR